jgi:hypothetical protein
MHVTKLVTFDTAERRRLLTAFNGTEGSSASTLQAHGPFHTQDRAEQWIKDTSADFWLESCGCLRTGDPEKWGDEHIIVQVVRKVKPVPPSSVVMTLVDTENDALSESQARKETL